MSQLHKRLDLATVYHLLQRFKEGHCSIRAACELLGVSKSRLYQLLEKWGEVAAGDISKRSLYERQRPSLLAPPVQAFLRDEIRFMKSESEVMQGHLNFALLAQLCHQRFGHRFHRQTLREWAIREHLYNPEVDPTGKAFRRFEMGGIGALFQHDTSTHLWVPAMKINTCLILTEDDHSRKVVGALLVPNDTTWHHLCVVRTTLETHGRPAAYYTDNHHIFSISTDIHAQFHRALRSLDILLKLTGKAHPEAKGKLEKRNDYFQRRIPYLCERYNAQNLTRANLIVRDEVDYYNEQHIHAETREIPDERWKRAIRDGRSYLRPLPDKAPLDTIFAIHYERALAKDGTFQFGGRAWSLPKAPRRGKVFVILKPPTSHRQPHTEITAVYKGGSQRFTVPASQSLKPHQFKVPHQLP